MPLDADDDGELEADDVGLDELEADDVGPLDEELGLLELEV